MIISETAKHFLNVRETAQYLGFSESAIRKWVRLGAIPFCRINSSIRFDIRTIEKWTQKKYENAN